MRSTGSPQLASNWDGRWWTASKGRSCTTRRNSASVGRSEIRILFVFDPWRSAILLIGGDKAGNWKHWYAAAIPEAERLYAEYREARRREEEQ